MLVLLVCAAPALAQEVTDEKVRAILSEGLETALVVIADTSGSMRDRPASGGMQNKIDIANTVLPKFVQRLPADIPVALMYFYGCQVRWAVPFESSRRDRVVSLSGQLRAGGATPIARSLALARDALKPRREKNPYGRFVVVLLTDGEETCLPMEQLKKSAAELAQLGIELHVIGFDLPSQDTLLKTIGTKYYFASDSHGLEKGLEAVQGELEVDATIDTIGK